MAGHAFLSGVGPLQLKIRQTVFEVIFRPTFRHVAIFAGLFGIVFFIKMPFMDILMTVHAPLSNTSELPFFVFQMAGKAGRRQMCPIQRETCFAMILKSE